MWTFTRIHNNNKEVTSTSKCFGHLHFLVGCYDWLFIPKLRMKVNWVTEGYKKSKNAHVKTF